MNTAAKALTFYRGETVKKVGAYKWPGVVLTALDTLAGEPRVVVECTVPEVAGALHIFNTTQIERIGDASALDPRAPSIPWESEAVVDVLAERRRQVEVEGWTPEHDDKHQNGELAKAATCYASVWPLAASYWPWDLKWWKPKGRRRDLVCAAALIIAEIERMDRAELQSDEGAMP